MAKMNIGLVKTIGVSFDMSDPGYSEALEASLRDFLSDRGIEESTRRKGIEYKMIEYDAEDMTVSWKRLEADLEDAFPQLKTQYSEGVDEDPEDTFKNDYEHLEIYT